MVGVGGVLSHRKEVRSLIPDPATNMEVEPPLFANDRTPGAKDSDFGQMPLYADIP